MVNASINPTTRRLSVFFQTDCRVTGPVGGLGVSTTIPIADGVETPLLLVEQMRWEAFVRLVEPRHTATVAALAGPARN